MEVEEKNLKKEWLYGKGTIEWKWNVDKYQLNLIIEDAIYIKRKWGINSCIYTKCICITQVVWEDLTLNKLFYPVSYERNNQKKIDKATKISISKKNLMALNGKIIKLIQEYFREKSENNSYANAEENFKTMSLFRKILCSKRK